MGTVILERSNGGDAEQQRVRLESVSTYREGVLRRADPRPGETLLDVGTDDGLIGFGALPLVGDSGRVIFSDVSDESLDGCRMLADASSPGDGSDDPRPMMDFDERDLFRMAVDAGFANVALDLEVRSEPASWFTSWDALVKTAGNPLDPTLEESMRELLTPDERERFERHVRRQIGRGRANQEVRVRLLRAVK